MATTIITGRDITFTIDSDNFDAQATSATLTVDSTINTYQTLDGKAYFTPIRKDRLPWKCWQIGEQLDRYVKHYGQRPHQHQIQHCLLYL